VKLTAQHSTKKMRVLVLAKRTSYRKLIVEDRDPRVADLIEKNDVTVSRMRRSHDDHEATVREVRAVLASLDADVEFVEGPRTKVEGDFDFVVTVGGDGTLLAASHRVGPGIPLLGVNSAPDHSVGFFCGTKKENVAIDLTRALRGEMPKTVLTRMRVDLDGVCLHARVLNEALFCHASPAATSRYILRVAPKLGGRERVEEQRSSGIWIGPAAGSTAAQKSAGGRVLPLTSKKIQYVVREPYTPAGVPLKISLGLLSETGSIEIRNKMRESKLFLDGHHTVFDVTIGQVITMRRSDETLTVLGLAHSNESKRTKRR
jgi:NAD+ kinase